MITDRFCIVFIYDSQKHLLFYIKYTYDTLKKVVLLKIISKIIVKI